MNHIDTVWILITTALVFFMTIPGLMLFYGGMVRARNVVNMFMQCFATACLMVLLWFVAGYSIAYGETNGYWGGLSKVFLNDVSLLTTVGTLPEILFFAFQMTFAIITPVIILGACAERVKFGFVLLFSGLWMLLVYAPVAHWVWGGGFLSDGGIFGEHGVRDFAGGLVVHETAGLAGLVLAIVIGPRLNTNSTPHSPGLVMIGAAMLWVGWLGFNGGSSLAADPTAAMALTVTIIAGAASSLSWLIWEYIKFGKFTLVGMVTGTLSGLASITPAAGFVDPSYALLIGAIAGMMCQEAVYLLRKFGVDDTLDVFAVHGVGGIYGSMMIAPLGIASWTAQLGSIAIIGAYTICVTLILIFFCKGVVGIRVSEEHENSGLDKVLHGQRGYELLT
ncbi:ammonium transporter [Marivita sp.]|jgi:Amt family ammonium transporter|uniref:ammonium transporter n=1 Tax=Marivita sp. TaxID=2003365 RepID=UPI00260D2CDA|nr:ammonium transporter [Marivita sp.]